MKIHVTIDVPDDELAVQLEKYGITREQFKEHIGEAMPDIIGRDSMCPSTNITTTIED
jgi:hypothetical protein